MRLVLLCGCLVFVLRGQEYLTPAGLLPASRTETGQGTVLPGGRLLSPLGEEFTTGPGPFGLAISPSGARVVTSNGGPNRFSLTVLEQSNAREIVIGGAGDDWKSAFMGLAFESEDLLWAAEGESGQVRLIDIRSGAKQARLNLNTRGFRDSYSGDLALDRERGILYIVDQANFRVAIFDTRARKYISSARVGRLPFAITLAPDRQRAYVTNVGMFTYHVLPGADAAHPIETGLPFPAFGFPSKEAEKGVRAKNGSGKTVRVPPLGNPNALESNSVCVLDVADARHPHVVKFVRTGLPFGAGSLGGSAPAGVLATDSRVFVSNSTNDSISILNASTLEVVADVPLRIAGLEKFRGILPIGMAYYPQRQALLVAEAGINAIAWIDVDTRQVLGHIPAAWFPTRVALYGDTVYVSNAKGHGIGPNADLTAPKPRSFQLLRRRGSLGRFPLPAPERLVELTRQTMSNNGFVLAPAQTAALPKGIRNVVVIVKENRTFDEVFGDIAGAPMLARFGRGVTPNHHALAQRFAHSDNFYADSEVSVDGHHWLVGSYPNVWTESSLMAAYADGKKFRLNDKAPGRLEVAESNSSVHPEDQVEAGTLWHHLDRNHISFRNFGEGFELAGVDEGEGLKPTGARYLTNVPMPEPLFENTSRDYPNFNMNIPDQFRASAFIAEVDRLYVKPGKPLPQFIYIHLPQDHMADPRPKDGYATHAAYVADNDYALGRIVDYLSHSVWWPNMAIFVTEDDANGGSDHVDAHRTLLLTISPFVKPGCVAHLNSSFVGMLKTIFAIFNLPPLNLFDAAARDVGECFTAEADFRPYVAAAPDLTVFDPAKVREPRDPKPGPRMDDPAELQKQH
jgi:YVTN family beta-propeller protein